VVAVVAAAVAVGDAKLMPQMLTASTTDEKTVVAKKKKHRARRMRMRNTNIYKMYVIYVIDYSNNINIIYIATT